MKSSKFRAKPMDAIFEAVLSGEQAVARILDATPQAHRAQIGVDVLVETIPHWLYGGDIPLHLAAAALKPTVAQLLLDAGSDPNTKNRRGATPLHYACDARPSSGGVWDPAAQAALISTLAARGAALDLGDRGGATPLHRAVRARSTSAVRRLLALGARTDCRLRARGSTPLHLAAQATGAGGTAGTLEEQLEIIELLRAAGADFAALDDNQRTARDWATVPRVAQALYLA